LSIHIADTQPAPFADGRKQKCCSSECLGEKAERGSKIDQNRVFLSRYPRLSPLPLTFLRKACGEVPDDLNSERESRQSRSTHGLSRNQLPALDLRTPGCIPTLSYTWQPFRNGLISVIVIGHRHESA
jgi:hypothetical protein